MPLWPRAGKDSHKKPILPRSSDLDCIVGMWHLCRVVEGGAISSDKAKTRHVRLPRLQLPIIRSRTRQEALC